MARRNDEFTLADFLVYIYKCLLTIIFIGFMLFVLFSFLMILMIPPHGYYQNPFIDLIDRLNYIMRPQPVWWYW